mmetsp:Transcript_13457/g.22071  ORF Transcript_13457/g.22071 Transcript_13457/m.22071 type:complete len:633 (-) Transcript_13457:62-1960(-)
MGSVPENAPAFSIPTATGHFSSTACAHRITSRKCRTIEHAFKGRKVDIRRSNSPTPHFSAHRVSIVFEAVATTTVDTEVAPAKEYIKTKSAVDNGTDPRSQQILKEVRKRRTFAIISHPDSGKTTLTEKLLLFGGAIQEAGQVKARRAQRHATSDWMALERERGISITSTVLQFDYKGCTINLLDTPGHQDFSEDSYRTLAAADNAALLIDGAKGIETQTRKLYAVAAMRNMPVFTFVNKFDRPSMTPLELVDEVEKELGLSAFPVSWPIGSGDEFKGVYDRFSRKVHLFSRTVHGKKATAAEVISIDDPSLPELLGQRLYDTLLEEAELIEMAGSELDLEAVHSGMQTPMFFGSAANNFGVQLFLDHFLKMARVPGARDSSNGLVRPEDTEFSGFVFKIAAGMNPAHRDTMAFLRICSGVYEKGMSVQNARTGKSIKLSQGQKLFGQDRETISIAYAGDVIGLTNPDAFGIGDTLFADRKLKFPPIPSFSPEIFSRIRTANPSKYKQFARGLTQLLDEGAVQVLYNRNDESFREPILAAVGQLQLEVVQARLQQEYGVETSLDGLPYTIARWVKNGWQALDDVGQVYTCVSMQDRWERPVLLFKNVWSLDQFKEDAPNIELDPIGLPPEQV